MNTETLTLDAAAVAAVDSAGQMHDILAMPDHIEDALWRAESAMIGTRPAKALVVCGMGGSAIGGDLALALLDRRLKGQVHVVRGYDLPSWVDDGMAVLCSSYSGNTEETLSCYKQAGEAGAMRYVASSGGKLSALANEDGVPVIGLPSVLQPRAAVAYMIVSALEVVIAAGLAGPQVRGELRAAVRELREACASWSPEAGDEALPKQLAREALGTVVAIYGSVLTAPIAYRWKCQINENAKVPAWAADLPESNHNDINGWEGAAALASHTAFFLRDSGQHERIHRRIDFTAEVIGEAGCTTHIVDAHGGTAAERVFNLVLLGDLTSMYLAVLRGVDPSPVPVIENLKDWLGRP